MLIRILNKPLELVPMHPILHVPDCESAPTAIDWPRFVQFLRDFKATGGIQGARYSDLGSGFADNDVRTDGILGNNDVQAKWKGTFKRVSEDMEANGEHVVWGIVDGYLLYWNPVRVRVDPQT